ncbi:phosphomannomutase [Maritalea sp.]|uniref:phosphomannomutase n=1 Tax=Maritalea sp. TaxID=2003361 RepID=UPI003EF705D3
MSQSPFKAYDVRGLIPEQMNVPFAYRFGQAVAHQLAAKTIVVGHDMRLDSAPFASAIIQGLQDSGVDVLPVGQCGTEEVYFHTDNSGADGGLMVTASHNPQNYNGIKMVLKGAKAATRDNALKPLEDAVMSDRVFENVAYEKRGKNLPTLDRSKYIARLLDQVKDVDLKPLKIVCHAGNGCAGAVIDALEEHLPFTFIKIDHEADGNLPNGIPNPLLPEKRAKAANAVKEHGADLGIAWDGDFDRCFFYDHTGEFVEGYYLVGLIAQTLLRASPGGKIIYDPRLTWNTVDVVEAAGGTPIVSKTGHAFFKQIMREEKAIYGGEMSAHHYFDDFSYCDTGMLPWLAIVSEISASGKTLKEMVQERIQKFPCSGEINFTVNDAPKIIANIEATYAPDALKVEHIDGLSVEYENWRFNIRSSNTEPLLRINVETRGDKALVEQKVAELTKLIKAE